MVKLFRTSETATTIVLSTTNKDIIVEVYTINDMVEEVVLATAPKASTTSIVETVEEIVEEMSVIVFWAINENMLGSITEVVNSTVEVVEVIDSYLVNCLLVMFTFWSLAIMVVSLK